MGLSTYEKEFFTILLAVTKWKHYLSPQPFIIKIDCESLKHLLEQRITTTLQHKGMLKLMGLEYTIKYKKGKENLAVNALSRRGLEEGSVQALTTVIPTWVNEVIESYKGDSRVQQIIAEVLQQPESQGNYSYQQRVLRYMGRIYIGNKGTLRRELIDHMHTSLLGGHLGMDNTYRRIKQIFYWPGLKLETKDRVKGCEVCLKNKVDGTPYAGLLQPIHIPTQAWQLVSMDFLEALPKSEGKDTILVVVVDCGL